MANISREEAIATLEEGRSAIADRLAKLSEDELGTAGTLGEWSAADLVGHLALWERFALESLASWRERRKPSIEDVFARDSVDEVNAEDVQRNRSRPPAEVRGEADDVHRRLLEELRSMGDDEWNQRVFYPSERRQTLRELLGSVLGAPKRPFGHAFAHVEDLDAYLAGRS